MLSKMFDLKQLLSGKKCFKQSDTVVVEVLSYRYTIELANSPHLDNNVRMFSWGLNNTKKGQVI